MKNAMKNKKDQWIPEVGTVVRSKTGRDRKRVFLVIGIDAKNSVAPVIIADGKLRKAEDRKHKNPAHLVSLGRIDEIAKKDTPLCFTNSEIAEICKEYDICNNFS